MTRKEIREYEREGVSEREELSEAAYNRFADGGRAKPSHKKVDAETAATIRRAFGIK